MNVRTRSLLFSLLSLMGALACFLMTGFFETLILKLILFVAGVLFVLFFFVSSSQALKNLFPEKDYRATFNLFMLLVSAIFSLLYFFSSEITGYDIAAHELIDTILLSIIAFVCVVICSIAVFKNLRSWADSFYTVAFTVSMVLISTLFYLFSDVLPASEFIDFLRLFVVVSSLSLALSLLLIEREKRKTGQTKNSV